MGQPVFTFHSVHAELQCHSSFTERCACPHTYYWCQILLGHTEEKHLSIFFFLLLADFNLMILITAKNIK